MQLWLHHTLLFVTMSSRGRHVSTLWLQHCWLGNHSEQKPPANSQPEKCYQLEGSKINHSLSEERRKKLSYKFGQAGSYLLIWPKTNTLRIQQDCTCICWQYKHTQQCTSGCFLPVSSDLPLVSLKELEWLPACLYFLNLSMNNNQSDTHTVSHINNTHTHSRMPISHCHGNSSTSGPHHRSQVCVRVWKNGFSPTWACRGWWWWR